MNKTQIEWVKNPDGSQGYTFNPITGCLNHANGMCKGGNFPCYAYRLAHGRLKERYLNPDNFALSRDIKMPDYFEALKDPFYPRFWPERIWDKDIHGHYRSFGVNRDHLVKAKGIFVCDMSDLFGIGIPEEWTKRVLKSISSARHHRYYLLTKQPQNLIKFSPFPDNCWVGMTVTTWKAWSDFLFYSPRFEAKVKYVSIEPLLAQLHFSHLDIPIKPDGSPMLDWLIIGSQTKPYKPPKIEWVKEIVEAADKAGIPVFLKDNLKSLFGNPNNAVPNILDAWWGQCNCFGVKLRQEMPTK